MTHAAGPFAPAPRSAPESRPLGPEPTPAPAAGAFAAPASIIREPTVPIVPAQFRPPDRPYWPPMVIGAEQSTTRSTYAPAPIPSQYAPPGQLPPPGLPGQFTPLPPSGPRRNRRWLAAAAVVVVLLAFLGIGSTVAVALNENTRPGAARVLAGPADAPAGSVPESNRDLAIDALLKRRTEALAARNRTNFLADVDRSDDAFLSRQQTVYDNMTKLPLVGVNFSLKRSESYDTEIPAAIRNKYGNDVRAAAVTVTYQVEGVDQSPVAVPWVPILALVSGQWKLVGEATGKELPSGVGGQPWDAGPVVFERGNRVVGVFSASYPNRSRLMKLADDALDRVAKVRPADRWAGKIFVIAVKDKDVFNAYFSSTPERVDQVAAIAVPHYNQVHEWANSAEYSATRIIFNPDELEEDSLQLGDDLTHEFTHAAMAPATTGWTPTWLVEGFAEYVSYKGASIVQSRLRQALKGVATDDLYGGDKFYDEPMNYITAWLACRMISEKYGEAKLIELYEKFQGTSVEDTVVNQVLGISRAQLVTDWQAYVAKQRA